MSESLLWLAVLAAPGAPDFAQPAPPAETLIRLNVQAMPSPKPAHRYLLLPDLREQTPGNPIPNYLKCFFEQDFSSEEEVLGPLALRQADRAARMDKPDWQLMLKLRTDGFNLLLPDLQKMRALAAALQTRFRDEIARGRIDDALYTARTMFALARHTGEHPTIIGSLVGIAIAYVSIAPLEELLERPGCPNLYWAMTNLPQPFIALDKGIDGERLLFLAEFGDLSDSEPMSPERIEAVLVHIDAVNHAARRKGGSYARSYLDLRVKDAGYVAGARARLVEYGIAERMAARFPADQVILLDERRKYEVRRDEEFKLYNLPTWEVEARLLSPPRAVVPGLFDFLMPNLSRVRRAVGRLEQRMALLRHVEALRLHAAAHDGKLPRTLADIEVPLPPDPFTGQPFRYECDGDTAHLRGTPPKSEANTAVYNLHYEVTIRK